ncbi:MAG: polysaccharide deacetylase family protein [Betaproteobacteria bacterium]
MGIGSGIKRMAAWLAPKSFVVSGRRGSRCIAITFDDGPHPENTPRILAALAEHGAKATFFLQGSMAEKNPELVLDIVQRGHQLGNHGYAHPDANSVPTAAYVEDVIRAQESLEKILGRKLPRLFRPPFGSITPGSVFALLRRGFCFIFWSLDSRDSYLRDSQSLFKYIENQSIPAGSILLFHDDYAHTVEILPRVLAHLKEHNFQLVTVGEIRMLE